MEYSEEQKAYIFYDIKEDTKLLATAGSGKTFCIIHRIQYLINRNYYSPHNIYMLTFSKNAKEDFIHKMRKHELDEVPVRNIHTIDSFAWNIIGRDIAKSIDVSILSYTLFRLLQDIDERIQNKENIDEKENLIDQFSLDFEDIYDTLKSIDCIFVDEAQDLNETQYNILVLLKKICKAELQFIGDPNQNIYQFRKSSDKFLVNYPAKTFYLTKNYRSNGHIVEFCKNLRPYNHYPLSYDENEAQKSKLDVTFYSYPTTQCFENYLLSILHFFRGKNIPLHKIAILAPTRGYLGTVKGKSKYKGLCYIANLLFKHDFPFQQFYNDTGSVHNKNDNEGQDTMQDKSKITYKVKKNHLNLMTYTGSKGLEWDYVIIIDANAHLISRMDYDIDKYNAEKYLLYVACSRPRKNLIIFTKHKYTNPWFKNIPPDKYRLARICPEEIEFFDTSKLFDCITQHKNKEGKTENNAHNENEKEEKKIFIDDVLSQLQDNELFEINQALLHYMDKNEENIVFPSSTFSLKIPENRNSFAQVFLEHFFYIHALQKSMVGTFILKDVENVIHCQNIKYCPNDHIIQWYYQNREYMTWEIYASIKDSLGTKLVEYIETRFDKNKPFSSYTLVDKFFDAFIVHNYDNIKNKYQLYIDEPTNNDYILFLSLVSHALKTTHYFYVMQFTLFKKDILSQNQNNLQRLAHQIRKICMYQNTTKLHNIKCFFEKETQKKQEKQEKLIIKNDFSIENIPVKLKPTGDEKLKDILYMILLLYIQSDFQKKTHFTFVFFCLSKNKIIRWNIQIPLYIFDKIYTIIFKASFPSTLSL